MAIYVFTTQAGVSVERHFAMGECPEYITLDGQRACRDYAAEGVHVTVKQSPVHRPKRGYGIWPMKPCLATAVPAAQAGELRKFHKQHGISADVTPDGRPIYTSEKQKMKAMKARFPHLV